LWSATAVVIGGTVGSGIFRSPAAVADRLHGSLAVLGVWAMGGLFALCGALTLAELAAAYPRTGGLYVFIREAWGKLPAFLFGWSELILIRAALLGAVSITFAEYLIRLLGHNPGAAPYDLYVRFLAAAAILVTGFLNYVGIRWGALVQNLTTIAKYGGLVFIAFLAFAIGLPRTGGYFDPLFPAGHFSLASLGIALVSVLWAYDGWLDASYLGGEIIDGQKTLPRALILGTAAVFLVYMLANVAYMAVLPIGELSHASLVAADVAERLLGPPGVVFIAAIVATSAFGLLTESFMIAPRIIFAMAADGNLFKEVAAVHPRFRTPYVAIIIDAALGILFVMLRSFEQLADAFVIANIPFDALGVAAVFVLRRRKDFQPGFRVPGYPVVPLGFLFAAACLLVSNIVSPSSRWPTVGVLTVIALGIPIYYVTIGRSVRVTQRL
jgi:amino acid transporter